MNRAATLALVLLALPLAAPAKDLIGVFEDAVHNDPVIRQADANRLAARESKPQALAALLPQLNGTAGITREHASGFESQILAAGSPSNPLLVPVRTADQIDNTIQQWSLNLRQNVFSWSNWMTLRAASHEVAQAEANYAAAEQQLILRVSQAYFNVLTAIDTLDADQTSLEAISRQLDQANKRFEVGLIAITDVEDAKAARDSAASTVIAAKRTLATSEDQLQEITGQKYDALAKPGANMPLNNPEPADQSRWVNISLEQNLSLISSRLSADIARENVHVAQGGHLPTLDLVAGRSWNYTSSDQIFESQRFSNVDSKVNDRQIGLQFTLPIYSGGFTQSKVRQAEYQWIAAKEGVVQSSRATERQARDAYLGVITGIARVQALRQAVESNQTSLKATEAGYEVGTRTSVDVLNARRLLVQAETDYATARYDYIVSVLQLRLAAGNLDRTQLAELNNWLTVNAPTSPPVATPESVSPTVPPSQPLPPATTPPPQRPQGKH
ncbi:MAG: TolC family outer membrane protein [Sinobacteraceae bacterium]|nr:TolC family outer membrane protein [Nevskiaceae bacterium]MBV9317501.1 TolC family outer membrane protein [Gammaproteobacteria bacterium]